MDLEDALREFDNTEANLQRLAKIWAEMSEIVPQGIAFMAGSPEGRRYDELNRAFADIAAALPKLDGWIITSRPVGLNELAQDRLDAQDVGEIPFIASVEERRWLPAGEIDEYQYRLNRARRALVRQRLIDLMEAVDRLLATLAERWPKATEGIHDPDWDQMAAAVREIDRLAGNVVPRTGRWNELRRHVHWAEGQDLRDIDAMDWPSVRKDLQQGLYSELEPLPVRVGDLTALVDSRPSGPVSTELAWPILSAEAFERLLYNILLDAQDYERPEWLIHTHAPDRGRDISAFHRVADSLSGASSERVILQAKHWLTKSVTPKDISGVLPEISLWEPPPVAVLIIATSGRFTADAVRWIETHNSKGLRPRIEMWPGPHIEALLAPRPHLVAEFGLRPRSL
jgi:hypothetical protein